MNKTVRVLCVAVWMMFTTVWGEGGGYIVGNTAEWMPTPSEEYVKHLTHLNLCFVRPYGLEGEVYSGFSDTKIKEIVDMGHRHGVKMGIAFGGGGVYIDSTIMKDTTVRAALISNLMDFVEIHNFDAIDNDWEPTWDDDEQVKFKKNQDMKAYYGIFTKEVRDSLDARFGKGVKEFSAAIMNKNLLWYNDSELMAKSNHFPLGFWEHLDYVSLMNYDDGTGSGHATYNAVFGPDGSVEHWKEQGIPIEKMCVGLPFFGRAGFGPQNWAAMRYNDIVDSFPDLDPAIDWVTCDVGGGNLSYGFNGPATIKRKQITADSLGMLGVMICFIDYDKPVYHPRSLLGTLVEYEEPVMQAKELLHSNRIQISQQQLTADVPIQSVSLYLPSGRLVWGREVLHSAKSVRLPVLAAGLYIVEAVTVNGSYREVYSCR